MILPEKEIKRLVKEYLNYLYKDIKKGVKGMHGSYNLLRVESLEWLLLAAVTTGIIKSKSNRRKKGSNGFRNPTIYILELAIFDR